MNSPAEAIFFVVMWVLTLAVLWRELALQYVITVAGAMYGVAALAFWLLKEPHWWLPLIVLNGRGVSRLVLYKFRERQYYGWWVIGLTCVLSSVLVPGWSTFVLAPVMQVASLPWLIKRRPGADAPSYFAAINWLMLTAWIVVTNAPRGE
jgi:hypothetical protein